MYFRTRVQIPAPPLFIEGLRPSNSPTRALARRCAGALRSRGSLAALARAFPTPALELPYTRSRAPLRRRAPFAWLARGARIYRGASPLELPDTRSRAPLRRRAPFAWLARGAHHLSRGFAPRTPLHALSRAAAPARSVRVARSRRSLARSRHPPPRTPLHALSRAASPARSVRVARSRGLARSAATGTAASRLRCNRNVPDLKACGT